MTMKTKVRKIGNSYGILLPKAALQAMKVREGDVLYVTRAPDDAIRVAPGRAEFEEKMLVARGLMDRYRNALRELAQ
jgi:putative addiction module antidote